MKDNVFGKCFWCALRSKIEIYSTDSMIQYYILTKEYSHSGVYSITCLQSTLAKCGRQNEMFTLKKKKKNLIAWKEWMLCTG